MEPNSCVSIGVNRVVVQMHKLWPNVSDKHFMLDTNSISFENNQIS